VSLHESFWSYRSFRWLKVTLVLVVVATSAYFADEPPGGAGGNTFLGYLLGTLSAGLMLWLFWFGMRKRSYKAAGAPLRGWLSAHTYLGLALVWLVMLHSGFDFGWNVHTGAFVLTVLVVLSGVFGVVVYTAVPERMTQNRPGEKLAALFERIQDIDTECNTLASSLPDTIARAVDDSIAQTRIGGGPMRLLRRRDRRCPTAHALRVVAEQKSSVEGAAREDVRKLEEMLDAKRSLLARVHTDLRLKALLDVWLFAHVPLASAALVAVAAHVFIVLYYR
jgi:hypothetical protein